MPQNYKTEWMLKRHSSGGSISSLATPDKHARRVLYWQDVAPDIHVTELIRWWWSNAVLRSSMQDKLKIHSTKRGMRLLRDVWFCALLELHTSHRQLWRAALVLLLNQSSVWPPGWKANCLVSILSGFLPHSANSPFFPQPLSWPVGGLRDHKFPTKLCHTVCTCVLQKMPPRMSRVCTLTSLQLAYTEVDHTNWSHFLFICCDVGSSSRWLRRM